MVENNRRAAIRIPAKTVEQIPLDTGGSIDVKIAPVKGAYEQTGALQDIHQNGMCFTLSDHVLEEEDRVYIDTRLGDFSFESDAIVRWTLGSYVGVEFLDTNARYAALLAELFTEKLLNFLDEPQD